MTNPTDDGWEARLTRIETAVEANANQITALLEIIQIQRAEHDELRADFFRFMTEHLREWHRRDDQGNGPTGN